MPRRTTPFYTSMLFETQRLADEQVDVILARTRKESPGIHLVVEEKWTTKYGDPLLHVTIKEDKDNGNN